MTFCSIIPSWLLRERTAPAAAVELFPHQLPGQKENPFLQPKLLQEHLIGQGSFWGQEALSSTAGKKNFPSSQPSPGGNMHMEEAKAMRTTSLLRAGESSSNFCVAPPYNALTRIFTIKCPSPVFYRDNAAVHPFVCRHHILMPLIV